MLALTQAIDVDLWNAHAAELMRFATVLVGPHDAADVVSDAFLGATRALADTTVAATHGPTCTAPSPIGRTTSSAAASAGGVATWRRSARPRLPSPTTSVTCAGRWRSSPSPNVPSCTSPIRRGLPRTGDRRTARPVARLRAQDPGTGQGHPPKGAGMNDPLDHAIRSALADIVATAPAPGRAAHLRAVGDVRDRTVRWRLPAAIVAAACLAVIGLAALAVTLRDDGGGDQPAATPEVAAASGPGRRDRPARRSAPPWHRRPRHRPRAWPRRRPLPRRPRPRRPRRRPPPRPAVPRPPLPARAPVVGRSRPAPPTCRRSPATSTATWSTTP